MLKVTSQYSAVRIEAQAYQTLNSVLLMSASRVRVVTGDWGLRQSQASAGICDPSGPCKIDHVMACSLLQRLGWPRAGFSVFPKRRSCGPEVWPSLLGNVDSGCGCFISASAFGDFHQPQGTLAITHHSSTGFSGQGFAN